MSLLQKTSRQTYRLLVRLCYPAWFRRRHGDGLLLLFSDRSAAAHRDRGALGLLREWPAAIKDAVVNGTMLRLRPDEPSIGAPHQPPHTTNRRPSRSPGPLDMLSQDLRFAWKLFRRSPGVSLVAVGTLAVGITATITMFTIVNGVVLRPLPFPQADRVVHLLGEEARGRWAVSYPDFTDVVEQASVFESAAAWQGWGITLGDEEGIARIQPGAAVSGEFFEVLGVEPALGRFFSQEEGELGHEPVVVISHGLWQERYGGREDVLGEPLFDNGSFPIIGVAPPGFIDPVGRAVWGSRPRIWRSRPDSFDPTTAARDWLGFWAVGRLAGEVSLEQANERVRSIGERLARSHPDTNEGRNFELRTLKDLTIGEARSTALLLLGSVAILLLIACANVANLLLSRGTARRQEIAVRTALGATRGRLVRQMMIESMASALLATAAGLVVAAALVGPLIGLAGDGLPRVEAIALDGAVVAFSALAAVLTALLFGTAPALQLSDQGSARALREGSRGSSAAGRSVWLRKAFVVGQTAMAVTLLVGAGLLAKSLWRLNAVDLGLETEGVLAARVVFGGANYQTLDDRVRGIERVGSELAGLPGVQAVSAISNRPMSGTFDSTTVTRDDMPAPEPGTEVRPLVRAVSADYFAAVGMPVLRGRGFTPQDRDPGLQVAIIDQEAARQLFGDDDPIGAHVTVRGDSREIVGIVGNVRNFGPAGDLRPVLYQPVAQTHQAWILSNMTFMIGATTVSDQLGEEVRRVVSRVDPSLPVANLDSMESVIADEVAAPRLRATLVLLFAGTATLLATVGLASVIAYSVSAQRRELAVRIALGAKPQRVVRQVLGQAARLAIAGVAVGIVSAWSAARITASLLFEVEPTDPVVFAGVAVLLLLVGLVAAAVPAARATRIDPASLLRAD